MTTFSIKITGLDQLAKDAQKIGGEMPGLLRNAMQKSTVLIKNDARRRVRFKTGTLRRSINRKVVSFKEGRVFVGEKYGIYIEKGTRAHTISPKVKKALRFRVGGKIVFARKVNHPGTQPYPFMEPAFKGNLDNVLDEFEKVGLAIVKKLGD